MAARRITRDDLRGHPGLRGPAIEALIARQPATVREALEIPDVGRKTTLLLLNAGLVTDPDSVQWGLPRRR